MTRPPGTGGVPGGSWGGLRPVSGPEAGRRRSEVPEPPRPDPTIPPVPPPPEPSVGRASRAEAAADVNLDDLVLRGVHEGGRRIGTVADVVLNCTLGRVLGLEVLCDGSRLFVPWVTVSERGGDLSLTVPLKEVPPGLSLLLAHGTRLSKTWHGAGLVVDRLGALRPPPRALAATAPGAA